MCRQLYFWMHAVVLVVMAWLLVAPPVHTVPTTATAAAAAAAAVDKQKQS